MNIRKFLRQLPAVAFTLLIAGCGGGGIQGDGTTGESDTGSTGGSAGNTGGTGATAVVRIGHINTSGAFVEGSLSVASTTLSAGGSTSVVANLVDGSGVPVTTSYPINFTSTCVSLGSATITSPVTSTTSGRAESTYTSTGCEITDTITASVIVGSSTLTATRQVTVAPASIGGIEFISASPEIIALKGSGGAETSTVVFKVVNEAGGPAFGAQVDFSLSTDVGGLQITPTSATSNASGLVQTTVTAGTVVTPVVVTATLAAPALSTQSSALKVGSGTPDQDSFSISVSMFNPEAWDYNGVAVDVTIHAADHANNRVPDGTVVSFWTEGGSIDSASSSCTTVEGSCTVKWLSQEPRPLNGRATILAYSVGDESFTDENGNGLFDAGENFTDLGEAFQDDNENGARDIGERFVDFNRNGSYDIANGLYDGVLCSDRANNLECGAVSAVHVRDSVVIAMSGNTPDILSLNDTGPLVVSGEQTRTYSLTLGDLRGQIMPAGTVISANSTVGKVVGRASYTVINGITGIGDLAPRYSFAVQGATAADDPVKNGYLQITVTTPKGIETDLPWVPVTD